MDLHEAEHHTAVEALRSSGATVSMTVLRERMVEPENAITTTPLRPEDDYFPRERRSSGLTFNLETTPSGPQQRLSTCLIRNDKGLGFSIAGGKGSTPYRTGDTVRERERTELYHNLMDCVNLISCIKAQWINANSDFSCTNLTKEREKIGWEAQYMNDQPVIWKFIRLGIYRY